VDVSVRLHLITLKEDSKLSIRYILEPLPYTSHPHNHNSTSLKYILKLSSLVSGVSHGHFPPESQLQPGIVKQLVAAYTRRERLAG
jgi:hypothetical protein